MPGRLPHGVGSGRLPPAPRTGHEPSPPSACAPLCELSSLPLDACLGWYLMITELVTVIITC